MKNSQPSLTQAIVRWVMLLVGIFVIASAALARGDDLPGRVGRVAQVEGRASVYDREQDRWVEALRNNALTTGDRLTTERGARVQLGIGSTEIRVAGDSELIFESLEDDRIVLVLQHGSAAVRIRNPEVAREMEVQTGHSRARPSGTGHFRFDRDGSTARMTVWRGSLQVDTGDQRMAVDSGRSVELFREWRDGTAVTWGGVAQDPFSDWVSRDEQRDDRLASSRYVSPEMTGADDLERYGRWDRHPEYGWVWLPLQVGLDWAPFRHGRWTWHARWGWTWLDDAPWGFATSHYGRWAHWGGRWVWAPGAYVSRPVYAPALVGWVGGSSPGFSVSVSVGSGPTVGWFPLSPYDVYVPSFRHPPRYVDRVNLPHRRPGVPPQVPTGPISYGNNGVPNAVTVVPATVMQQRQPVAPAVLRGDVRGGDRGDGDGRRWTGGGAPPPGARLVPVPGGAVPVGPVGQVSAGPGQPVVTAPGVVTPVLPAAGVVTNVPVQPMPTMRSQPVPQVVAPPVMAQPAVVAAPVVQPVPVQPPMVMPPVVPQMAPQVAAPTMRVPQPDFRDRPQHSSQEIARSPAMPVPAPAARPPMAPVPAPMAPVAAPMAPVRIEAPQQRIRVPEQSQRREGRDSMRERQERQ